jgi:hypothetical protein
MTSCPDCSSGKIENKGTQKREREDDEHEVKVTGFICRHCGCKFRILERFEAEVVEHGRAIEE